MTVHIEQVRAAAVGPAVVEALYGHRLPYYTVTVGGPFGLDPDQSFCAICGGGFQPVATFAYASSHGAQVDRRVGRSLLIFHHWCLRLAEDENCTLDEWFRRVDEDSRKVAEYLDGSPA